MGLPDFGTSLGTGDYGQLTVEHVPMLFRRHCSLGQLSDQGLKLHTSSKDSSTQGQHLMVHQAILHHVCAISHDLRHASKLI